MRFTRKDEQKMTFIRMGMTLACVLTLTACQDFRLNENGFNGYGVNGTGAGMDPNLADANNPTSVGYFNQTIGDRVLFQVDQSILTPTAIATLDGQVDWLLANTSFTTTIEGHADEQGTREYNLALGARRANSVRDYLVSHGVAANRIDIVTYGKERPLAVCSTEDCWSKNRRAVTLVATQLLN
jgi:peptidoglycan-associated lipoprotein